MYSYMVDGGLVCYVQYTAVTKERDKTIDMQAKNKGGGPSLPSNYSFIVKS